MDWYRKVSFLVLMSPQRVTMFGSTTPPPLPHLPQLSETTTVVSAFPEQLLSDIKRQLSNALSISKLRGGWTMINSEMGGKSVAKVHKFLHRCK